MAKITKREVDALKPRDDGKDALLWDDTVKGFGVRCRASGGKTYVLKYRTNGRARWVTIGRHGSPWTPDGARKEARRLLGEKESGNDPAAVRDHEKGVPTVAELGDRFLREHVAVHCASGTAYEYERSIHLFINPWLGQIKITDLTRADVARIHQGLADKPYQANRTLGVLSTMMNKAEAWGLIPDGANPTRHVKKYQETRREKFLDETGVATLWRTLDEVEKDGSVRPYAVGAIRLLILTGARLSEVLNLKWDHVDLRKGVLNLPTSKTGAKTIRLHDEAVRLLQNTPYLAGNPYIFPGEKEGEPIKNLQKPWRRIRERAGLNDLRIHDLRHTFASFAVNAGHSLPVIGELLGHSRAQTTARYAHLQDRVLREANEDVGSQISNAINGKE